MPWAFDDEAVEVTRVFTRLKMRLMPYLYQVGLDATRTGAPIMRPMQLEFPEDPTVAYLDPGCSVGGSGIRSITVTAPDGVSRSYTANLAEITE